MSLAERNTWRLEWLHCIYELTSLDLQRKLWLSEGGLNLHNSFTEFVCCYLDDILANCSYDHYISKGWVSRAERDCINEWHTNLDTYVSPNGNDWEMEAILNDPSWLLVVRSGEQARSCLVALLSGEERDILFRAPDGA